MRATLTFIWLNLKNINCKDMVKKDFNLFHLSHEKVIFCFLQEIKQRFLLLMES